LNIAIDFTLSNGKVDKPNSLHRIDSSNQNEYLHALTAVGNILQYYDADKEIPIYGFGATLPPHKVKSHCFALNGDIFEPECNGIEGAVEAYKHSIRRADLSGPTRFNEIIQEINERCEAAEISAYN